MFSLGNICKLKNSYHVQSLHRKSSVINLLDPEQERFPYWRQKLKSPSKVLNFQPIKQDLWCHLGNKDWQRFLSVDFYCKTILRKFLNFGPNFFTENADVLFPQVQWHSRKKQRWNCIHFDRQTLFLKICGNVVSFLQV